MSEVKQIIKEGHKPTLRVFISFFLSFNEVNFYLAEVMGANDFQVITYFVGLWILLAFGVYNILNYSFNE